ncbi:MAG: Mov34/MPN/PAD-1 family protein [Candidatus Binatia bacterium]|nr:Mov34/MPN/PAD-1 family protein [bacterium]MDG1400005.1 Mov34/MPN/PAD-1 family protein [Candidatus Binatia bacterium]MDG1959382.1 Mov34/MPN/PAD-1 family protein [Candidatus Binatia bacterium]MDG2010556.1 Mov34/MPN/PAD-1 family protein [Candidatus Binatia bacterium]HAC81005.1 hypothetical protein [Deltaproteobacteria bacterium]|tara:strand:- start:60 stop:524 length:465 start_codon:yes stop_codon:yes gene_type:complete
MIELEKDLYDEIKTFALEAFPEECCGFILYDIAEEKEVVRPISNVATERHAADPKNFPRDGSDGYIMEEKELLTVSQDLDSGAYELRSIYHSHPNSRAYFSSEDEARAMLWDEPIYPEAVYIVLGVDGKAVHGMSAHQWNEERREFEDVRIRHL